MEDILFSIVMANYNNANYLIRAINSVKIQTYRNWELIIVDDNSSDNSLEIIEVFVKDNPNIKLHRLFKNNGVGYVKKTGFSLCSGDLIGILDSDDALEADALESIVDEYKKNLNTSIIWSYTNICDSELKLVREYRTELPEKGQSLLDCLARPGVHPFHFITVIRNKYLMTDGIDDSLQKGEDHDLFYKLEEVGDLHLCKKFLYNYRIHSTNMSVGKEKQIRAFSWFFVIIYKTCKRRSLNYEDYASTLIKREFYSNAEYRIGKILLGPVRRLLKK